VQRAPKLTEDRDRLGDELSLSRSVPILDAELRTFAEAYAPVVEGDQDLPRRCGFDLDGLVLPGCGVAGHVDLPLQERGQVALLTSERAHGGFERGVLVPQARLVLLEEQLQ